ncbi:hypothetical protein [Bradyrhizobium sp. RDT46]|uniref:hypothetical protein n=1 Tax=Bradyrhizobium sp. RDT46 TaxID=3341829 RepID=UPI0035C69CBE
MSTTLKQLEAVPETYPTLDPAVPDAVWARLESYIAWRFTPRAVTWVAEGPGAWCAPLAPAAISTVEIWNGATWEAVTLDAAPLASLRLPSAGPFKITAVVGSDMNVPAIVAQAAQRLAGYMSAKPGTPGATTDRIQAGTVEIERSRSASWMASALQNSGAADLLRNYRRA